MGGLAEARYATPRTESRKTRGQEVLNVMKLLGFKPMPWQEQVLNVAYEVDESNQLVHREVVLVVPRQAGKTSLQLAVVVHRAFMFGERQLSFYTAQTRNDARAKFVNDDLPRLADSHFEGTFKPVLASGNEGLLWDTGSRHRVVAPTKKAGHGSSIDLAVLDEAFAFPDDSLEQGFKPAMVTRKDAQTWIMSAAGDETSYYLQAKRDLGRQRVSQGANSGSCYFEWSSELEATDDEVTKPATWAKVHPAIGYTIDSKTIAADLATMERDEFCRAYLAIWPKGNAAARAIRSEDWAACLNDESTIPTSERVVFALDIKPDRSAAFVSVAGLTADGHQHVEVIEARDGTEWLVGRLKELLDRWKRSYWTLDVQSGAATLLAEVPHVLSGNQQGRFIPLTTQEVAKASQYFYDAVKHRALQHRGQSSLDIAVSIAEKREYGNTWVWKRSEHADITPLRTASFALWALANAPKETQWLIA